MSEPQVQANVRVAQDAYAAFGRGDLPAILALMTPNAVIGIVGRKEDAPFLGMNEGPGGVGEFFQQLGAAHEIHTFEPYRFLGAEEKVFVWGRYRWTMRKSGVSRQSEWLHVLSVEDGKIRSWHGHNDTAMLAAAYHGRG
jgi:uncharacterized protein